MYDTIIQHQILLQYKVYCALVQIILPEEKSLLQFLLFHKIFYIKNLCTKSSLLHLTPEEVCSVEITNPIELGTAITDKTFILDIKVSLNSYIIINLELQVINQHDWTDRSLSYLCRNFDNLHAGENYQNVRPVIQIGLLNFTLFSKLPEFYATYKLLNVKNHSLYSDKLQLSVSDLTHIELATEEDKSYQLDY